MNNYYTYLHTTFIIRQCTYLYVCMSIYELLEDFVCVRVSFANPYKHVSCLCKDVWD